MTPFAIGVIIIYFVIADKRQHALLLSLISKPSRAVRHVGASHLLLQRILSLLGTIGIVGRSVYVLLLEGTLGICHIIFRHALITAEIASLQLPLRSDKM